jgi:hypothetical protein
MLGPVFWGSSVELGSVLTGLLMRGGNVGIKTLLFV